MKKELLFLGLLLFIFLGCSGNDDPITPVTPPVNPPGQGNEYYEVYMLRAENTFDAIFNLYWSDKLTLFYGSHPNDLGTPQDRQSPTHNVHAFLWGFGGVLSAFNAILENTDNSDFRRKYETNLKNSLDQYLNTSKTPVGYGCFVYDFDDRLYDDAIWVGIDLVDLYTQTKDSWYLDNAKIVWNFVMSGKDDVLGGGIYWEESPKDSKNTCSNAPAVVLGVKLYQATHNEEYLNISKEVYQWTKNTLQDPSDYLYWDNIKTTGTIGTSKFSYNSGQMLQAGVLLYNATKNEQYLNDAKLVAEACYNFFFTNFISSYSGDQFRIIKDGQLWFNGIMVRGFVELNKVEEQGIYMKAIRKSLDHGWNYARDPETGLFNANLSGNGTDENKDILYQGAIAEMFARLAVD